MKPRRTTALHAITRLGMAFLLLTGLLAALPVSSARAATGGPDSFGYQFIDSNSPGGPAYNFQDISASGTAVTLTDDSVSPAVPIGFSFSYYGVSYTSAYISSNGFISMSDASYDGCCTGSNFPNTGTPNGVIAGWWEDLLPPSGGSITYRTLGSSPSRVFIVQYTDIQHYPGGNPVTFQIKLFETSNKIEVHYQTIVSDGGFHSAGIEDPAGTIGLQYYRNTGVLSSSLAVRYYTHGPIPTVDDFTAPAASDTLAIPISSFAASDDVAVTGYMITTNSTAPASGAAGWTATAPTAFTVAGEGSYTLYPWAKDAAGNVSALFASPATVLVDVSSPAISFGTGSVPPADGTTYTTAPSQLVVQFSEDVLHDGSPSAADSLWNYLLVGAGPDGTFDTTLTAVGICDADHMVEGDDLPVRLFDVTYDPATFAATVTIEPLDLPLANGQYRLYVCGAASVDDLAGNPLNGGANSAINFTIGTTAPAALPNTGFAPGRVTLLPEQTASYAETDLWLEIPRLGVQMDIVGVPQANGEWDVTWLGQNAGWLEGSAFPTWEGNSVITGHVWNADNTAGPFRAINTLWYGDQIVVHAWGAEYVYSVRSVLQVGPGSTAQMLKHEELPWVTLVTCRGYDAATGEYRSRVLVRAVLVEVR